ncbi:hypothetical protein EV144_101597 [Flavobacterium sp. 270]|uniref:hypothetical protein n=1 Tax=Flavobacterium sp. 270 TaxID=2512114 RepID=UPI0010650C9B|nr:hypothetical protein [Flavobacterium sp. 270]TDW51919.1 hypothetical protein EV144_101597 [Flavobacterium sp. 270]
MSIFRKIFGTNKNVNSVEKTENQQKAVNESSNLGNTPELFKKELYNSLDRYYSTPDSKISLNLTDKDGTVYKEHEAFEGTFENWKGIRSAWDRRSVLFEHWDTSLFNQLEKWQVIERFVKDRYGLKADEFKKNNIGTEDLRDIRLIVALSKLYRVLLSHQEALYYAEIAYELRPDLDIVKVEYATVLHLSSDEGDKEKSHTLMNEVIENKIKKETGTEVALLNYFFFSKDYIDSSIFTIMYLNAGNCDLETWDRLAEEYYWCPNFRYEHSVYLNNKGETLKAAAKLNSLADEFPWYKTAVLANISTIEQLRALSNNPDFMEKELIRMKQYTSMWTN